MKRNHASHLEVGTNFADGRDVWLELFVPLRVGGRPNYGRLAKDNRYSRAFLPEAFKDIRIHLAKFLNRCATPRMVKPMPNVVDPDLYGNQVRFVIYDV
jgi:hypothetical protein